MKTKNKHLKTKEKEIIEVKMKEKKKTGKEEKDSKCSDKFCPFHGHLKARGRIFEGYVTRKFPTRVAVEFERSVYVQKYERYEKKKTRIHARLPKCMEVEVGDYIKIRECKPLSKIIHFVVIEKIRSEGEK